MRPVTGSARAADEGKMRCGVNTGSDGTQGERAGAAEKNAQLSTITRLARVSTLQLVKCARTRKANEEVTVVTVVRDCVARVYTPMCTATSRTHS